MLSLYARGLTVREIQGHLEALSQIEIAPAVISVYVAWGVDLAGRKDVLGLWGEQTEGAGFWRRVMTELQARGVEDGLIGLIGLTDGLRGFPDAIHAVCPQAQVHHCVVPVRQSLGYVAPRERKAVAAELEAILPGAHRGAAEAALGAFEQGPVRTRDPTIAPIWRRHWEYVRPVFADPPLVRRLLYTTNAIESLHMQLRKVPTTRGSFPTDEAAVTLLYLAIRHIPATWINSRHHGTAALTYVAHLFGDRLTPEV